ncbi:MAG: hypothetical protein WCO63_16090 [Bacteroidota bacterium]
METIKIFDAIAQMRKITAQGGSFSLIHATFNRDSGACHGKKYIKTCRLRPQATKEKVANADHKLFYYDIDEGQPLNCWQALLMFFNGQRITTYD